MKNKIQLYGVLGLIGAIGVGIGQFLMHYSAQGYTGEDLFHFFKDIPQDKISIGHYLAVLFLPFYLGGYWHIYLLLLGSKPQSTKWLYRFSVFFITIYAVWIGSQAILSIMVKDNFNNGIEHYVLYNQNLIWIVNTVLGFISITFFYIVWFGKTILPKWFAFCSPAIILVLIHLLAYLAPNLGSFFLATSINIAHFLFFGGTSYFTYKSKASFSSYINI